MWKEDVRETDEEVAERGMKFLKWYFLLVNFIKLIDCCLTIRSNFCYLHLWKRLWNRKEKEIAIVSHSGFLFHTLSAFGNDCHQVVKDEICTQ